MSDYGIIAFIWVAVAPRMPFYRALEHYGGLCNFLNLSK